MQKKSRCIPVSKPKYFTEGALSEKNRLGQWEQFERNKFKGHCTRAGQEGLQNKSKHFALYPELWLTGIQNEGGAGQLKRLEGHCHVSFYGTFSPLNKGKGM